MPLSSEWVLFSSWHHQIEIRNSNIEFRNKSQNRNSNVQNFDSALRTRELFKSEIRISKSETNLKFKTRMFKTFGLFAYLKVRSSRSYCFEFWVLVILICFEFRASIFDISRFFSYFEFSASYFQLLALYFDIRIWHHLFGLAHDGTEYIHQFSSFIY